MELLALAARPWTVISGRVDGVQEELSQALHVRLGGSAALPGPQRYQVTIDTAALTLLALAETIAVAARSGLDGQIPEPRPDSGVREPAASVPAVTTAPNVSDGELLTRLVEALQQGRARRSP